MNAAGVRARVRECLEERLEERLNATDKISSVLRDWSSHQGHQVII